MPNADIPLGHALRPIGALSDAPGSEQSELDGDLWDASVMPQRGTSARCVLS